MRRFHQRIIEAARSAIKNKAKPDKFSHATLILVQKKIICVGVNNQCKTHTKAFKDRPTWAFQHSELASIIRFKKKCGIDFNKTCGYNVRIGKSGNVLMSRPCPVCQQLIIGANFKNFYYTNNLGLFEEFVFKPTGV